MKEINKIKLVFVGAFTALNSFLGVLAIPVYILVGTNIVDYVTGIIAAIYRGEKMSSEIGLHGIAKKICMWLLVAVGYTLDYIIITAGATLGIQLTFNCLVAVAVVFWLLANELISILENINDIGTPLPPFLMKLVELVRDKAEVAVHSEHSKKE